MSLSADIPAGQRQQAYDYYAHHRSMPLEAIATFLGVSPSTFRRLRRIWGWPPRYEAMAQTRADGPVRDNADCSVKETAPSSLRDAALSLARVTRAHIDALVGAQRREGGLDHDRMARTLASYAKTLAMARTLLEQEGSILDGPEQSHDAARSIHELRDELARHLERVIAEEEARGSDGLLV